MRGLQFPTCMAAALVSALTLIITVPARAVPLDPQACEQLQLKLDELRKFGVESDMALGVEAARSTLPIERFNRIGVYIETEEQLNFRCGLAKQHIVLPTTIEGGEEEIPAPGEASAEGSPGAPPLPQRAPRATRDPAAKVTVVPKTPAAAAKTPDAAPKRRPPSAKPKDTAAPVTKPAATGGEARKATKKKADDAYRPPVKPVAGQEKAAPTAKQ
jgi:hypothetical protein